MKYFQVSRGSDDPRKMNNQNMAYHIRNTHKDISLTYPQTEPEESTSNNDFHRPPSPFVNIFNLRTHMERKAMLHLNMPGYVESTSLWPFHSPMAQRVHKTLFEQMVVDLVPFHEVNKMGLLRTLYVTAPNFKVASASYYRSLVDPTYDKIRYVFFMKLDRHIQIVGLANSHGH